MRRPIDRENEVALQITNTEKFFLRSNLRCAVLRLDSCGRSGTHHV